MPERWLLIVWTVWGGIIASLVGWFDRNLYAALAWLAVGIVIGSLGSKLVEGLGLKVFDWCHGFWKDRDRDKRMDELLMRMLESAEATGVSGDEQHLDLDEQRLELMRAAPEWAEFERLGEEDSLGAFLGMPVFVGLVHGSLLGGIAGALSPLDPSVRLPAWQGAVLGILVGIVAVSFLAAIIFAVYVPMPQRLSLSTRLARRIVIAVSPLFVVPIAWHYFRSLTLRRIT
ncbi:MAG TPA: hypothetical protein VGI40_21205 [Pirellulaceae bacterium]|jgi:hypothetical protein